MIFLLLVSGLIFSRCEAPVSPVEDSLNGTWNVTWFYDGEELKGDMTFEQGKAEMRAFGEDGSVLLNDFEEATFFVEISDWQLILTNVQSGVRLEYLVISRKPDFWQLSYLNEVDVHLQRNSN